jgi:cell division protein FtsW (lipid II flippase)
MRSRLSSFRHSIDLGLFLPTAGLLLIGLMVVGSLRLSDPNPVDAWKSTLVWGHLVRTAIALVLMVGVMSVPLERIQRVGLLLCLFVLGIPIIYEFNAFYWIGIAVWRPTWLYVDLPLFGGRSVNWLHWVLLAIPLALASWMAWVERERWPIALVTAVGLLVPVFLILAEHPFRGGWILLVALAMLAVARWRGGALAALAAAGCFGHSDRSGGACCVFFAIAARLRDRSIVDPRGPVRRDESARTVSGGDRLGRPSRQGVGARPGVSLLG